MESNGKSSAVQTFVSCLVMINTSAFTPSEEKKKNPIDFDHIRCPIVAFSGQNVKKISSNQISNQIKMRRW